MTRISWSLPTLGLAALAVAGLGLAAGWALNPRGADASAPAPIASPPVAKGVQERTPNLSPAAPSSADLPAAAMPLPPYMASASSSAGATERIAPVSLPTALPAGVPSGDAAQRIQRLQELADRLDRMRQSGRVDMAETDRILGELEKAWGSSDIAGLRIDAIRKNMQTASQALHLNEEIERLRGKKELSDEDRKAMEAKQKELLELARRMGSASIAAAPATEATASARVKP